MPKTIDPAERLTVRHSIDTFAEGAYCHSRILGDRLIPMHSHENKYQLMYAEGKCIRVCYKSDGELTSMFIPARHFAWIPRGVEHSVEVGHPDVQITNIFYTEVLHDPFYTKTGVYAASNLLVELLHHIKMWNTAVHSRDKKKYSILHTIMCILSDESNKKLPIELPVAKNPRLQEILDFMHYHMPHKISIGNLAGQYGMSERSLLRLFREDVQMSYAQYLKTLRVVKALELLTSTSMTINQIAYEIGYESLPTFSNTFREMIGVRPKVYRA
ncbi:MAG: helix-turn-helix domain-containing protein [Saprospiraceae bacterium]|nr:helix-turn-helix domain-containing protein [Saprospiraceae bacterium]